MLSKPCCSAARAMSPAVRPRATAGPGPPRRAARSRRRRGRRTRRPRGARAAASRQGAPVGARPRARRRRRGPGGRRGPRWLQRSRSGRWVPTIATGRDGWARTKATATSARPTPSRAGDPVEHLDDPRPVRPRRWRARRRASGLHASGVAPVAMHWSRTPSWRASRWATDSSGWLVARGSPRSASSARAAPRCGSRRRTRGSCPRPAAPAASRPRRRGGRTGRAGAPGTGRSPPRRAACSDASHAARSPAGEES